MISSNNTPPQPVTQVVVCSDHYSGPVQAVVLLIPKPNGEWKKDVSCQNTDRCVRCKLKL